MAPLRVATFANTFLVTNNGHDGTILSIEGPQETRKKRPHRKSRLGCVRCKKRKVKCDEGDPCRNCVKRNETCTRGGPALSDRGGGQSLPPLTSAGLPREVAWSPFSEPESGPVNLLHMELLHHFERYSIPTLSFQVVWPKLLQIAFQSGQHTYLVNAMLSFAAAHLDYLAPGRPQYHRAKYALLDKALHDYREALSGPITAANCDALLGAANLVQFLMWCDLSFMEGQSQTHSEPLDLSGDRLYFLSTGVRQIFFMAWPLFQAPQSAFMQVNQLQQCMALEGVVEARGLDWKRYVRAFMGLYDNPRYCGGPRAFSPSSLSFSSSPQSSSSCSSPTGAPQQPTLPLPSTSPTPTSSGSDISSATGSSTTAYHEALLPGLPSTAAPPYRIMTLWQSYKDGEAYVARAGAHDEALMRAAYSRLVTRLAIAMAYVADATVYGSGATCPMAGGHGARQAKPGDMLRFVTVFPMMCFGPLLGLISSGDSRMLVVLFHIYRVVGVLLPGEMYWWCRRRVTAMEEAIGCELRSRGLEVCLRRQGDVA